MEVPIEVIKKDELKWAVVEALTVMTAYNRGNMLYVSPTDIFKVYNALPRVKPISKTASKLTVIKYYLKHISESEFGLGTYNTKTKTYYLINTRKIKDITGNNMWEIEGLLATVIMDA